MILCMEVAWTPRRQGGAGELSAINWLFSAGALVCKPLFESPDYDFIADFGDRIERVQVKTSTCRAKTASSWRCAPVAAIRAGMGS
jgi:PD-(D/E)XK endonuclease